MKTPQSLKPSDPHVLDGYIAGHPLAKAITESWRSSLPIREMTASELEELSERCRTTFTEDRR